MLSLQQIKDIIHKHSNLDYNVRFLDNNSVDLSNLTEIDQLINNIINLERKFVLIVKDGQFHLDTNIIDMLKELTPIPDDMNTFSRCNPYLVTLYLLYVNLSSQSKYQLIEIKRKQPYNILKNNNCEILNVYAEDDYSQFMTIEQLYDGDEFPKYESDHILDWDNYMSDMYD